MSKTHLKLGNDKRAACGQLSPQRYVVRVDAFMEIPTSSKCVRCLTVIAMNPWNYI